MRKNRKYFKPMTREAKDNAMTKAAALERESNITLISITVIIFSFFLLLYVHSAFKTNYSTALDIINVVTIILFIGAVVCAVLAVWKKRSFLWEYVVFAILMAVAYYFLPRGASGIPGLMQETEGMIVVTDLGQKLSGIITSQNIIYALWGINVLYCIFTIVFHSARYTKIKKGNI